MSYGFVYLLTNYAMPHHIKIGMTERSPHKRAEELSAGTAVPAEFEVYGYVEVSDCAMAERVVHQELARFRTNPSREFFRIKPLVAWARILDILEEDSLMRSESDSCVSDRDLAEWHAKNAAEEKEYNDAVWGNVHDFSKDYFDTLDRERKSTEGNVVNLNSAKAIGF